ncbi:DUF4167 domain-containing protein, partial [Sphingomonas bacterium]|uniref:DUF4167 domain-containing protein n=1 Tax=Sphingomonas bacterium TaxID=1895847 RepID=UPI001576BC8A
MINNRQGGGGGRRRGRGGNNSGGGGGGGGGNGPRGPQNNGSRIDSRARGNATQLLEKYKNMAADAQRAGDRVNTEYYLQFADHYFRVVSEQRGRFEDQQPRRGRDDFDADGDDEFGDEGEPVRGREGWDAAPEPVRAERDEGQRRREAGDDRLRDGGQRESQRDGAQRDAAQRDAGRGQWRDRPERPRADAP